MAAEKVMRDGPESSDHALRAEESGDQTSDVSSDRSTIRVLRRRATDRANHTICAFALGFDHNMLWSWRRLAGEDDMLAPDPWPSHRADEASKDR